MKKALTVITVLVLLAGIYFTGSGFIIRKDVVLSDFSFDGNTVTLKTSVTGSAGYVRAVKDISEEKDKAVLEFFSAFGGINGKIMRKSSFDISLEEETKEIYFYREDAPLLVLYKNEEGQWQRT